MAERSLDEIIKGYQEMTERLQSTTPSVQPVWTPPPAPTPQYPAPQVLQQASQLSYLSMRLTPQAPLSIGPSPGRTGMFTDPYEAAIQQQLAGQAGYMDPAGAATYMGRGMVQRGGEQWGGVAGGIVGGAIGSFAGASWGASIGGALGEYLPDIPLVGPALSWGVGQTYSGAAQQLSGVARLQQGTRGRVQMGQQETGLGGTGMSGQAALDLTKRLQGMETEAFNVNDLINLTVTGAQTGMLMGATDIATIADRVKGLMRIVGEMARLTGDPDFRRSLQQISELRQTGFSVEQAVGFVGELGVYGRMAGMEPGQVMQAGGVPGGQIFQQYGMAPAPGIQLGAANLAAARAGIGEYTPIQQGLYGGAQGISNAQTQQQAQFMTQFMRPMMGALVRRGEGGAFELDPERLQQLPELLKEGRFGETMQRGGRFVSRGGPGDISRFMGQLPELTSEFAQQYAGGIKGMMMTGAMGIGEKMELEGPGAMRAGFSLIAGSPEAGRQLMLTTMNQKALRAERTQQGEQLRRRTTFEKEAFEAQKEELEQQIEDRENEEFKSTMRRRYGQGGPSTGGLSAWWERRQARKAEEVVRETERATAEAQGYQPRFVAPMPEVPTAYRPEVDIAELGPEAEGAFTPGERGVLGVTPEHEVMRGRLHALFPQAPSRSLKEFREQKLRSIRETGKIFKKVSAETVASTRERETIFRRIWGKLGLDPGNIALVKEGILALASGIGKDGDKGVSKAAILGKMKETFMASGMSEGQADTLIDEEEDMLMSLAAKTISQSNDPNAKKALLDSRDIAEKAGVWDERGSTKELDRIREKFRKTIGITGPISEEHMKGMQEMLGTEEEPVSPESQQAALLFLKMQQLPAGEERLAARRAFERLPEEQRRKGEAVGRGITTKGGGALAGALAGVGMEEVSRAAELTTQYLETAETIPERLRSLKGAVPTTPEAAKKRGDIESTMDLMSRHLDVAMAYGEGGEAFKLAVKEFSLAISQFIQLRVPVK